MDLVLIALGVLGFGAIAIAAYVFTVAARNYVSSDQFLKPQDDKPSNGRVDVEFELPERRGDRPAQFPLTVDGITVVKDRRQHSERGKDADQSARQ